MANESKDWNEFRRSKIGDRKHNTLNPAQTEQEQVLWKTPNLRCI